MLGLLLCLAFFFKPNFQVAIPSELRFSKLIQIHGS
jgi:hypothetical protein